MGVREDERETDREQYAVSLVIHFRISPNLVTEIIDAADGQTRKHSYTV